MKRWGRGSNTKCIKIEANSISMHYPLLISNVSWCIPRYYLGFMSVLILWNTKSAIFWILDHFIKLWIYVGGNTRQKYKACCVHRGSVHSFINVNTIIFPSWEPIHIKLSFCYWRQKTNQINILKKVVNRQWP